MVTFPISTTLGNAGQIASSIDSQLKTLEEALKKAYFEEVNFQLRSPAFIEVLIQEASNVLYQMQETYWGGSGSIVLQEDPTQLGNPEQIAKLREEITANMRKATVNPATGQVHLVLISDEFMGTGASKTATGPGIPWLHYFINGHLDGDLIWINPKIYELLKHHESPGKLGRFGVGYMWHVGTDEKASLQARLDAASQTGGAKVSLSDLIHGQSGKGGRDWFGTILEKINWEDLVVKPAMERAVQRVAMTQLK